MNQSLGPIIQTLVLCLFPDHPRKDMEAIGMEDERIRGRKTCRTIRMAAKSPFSSKEIYVFKIMALSRKLERRRGNRTFRRGTSYYYKLSVGTENIIAVTIYQLQLYDFLQLDTRNRVAR